MQATNDTLMSLGYVCGMRILWKRFYSEQYLPGSNCINVFLNFASSYWITFESKYGTTAKASENLYTNVLEEYVFVFPSSNLCHSKQTRENHPNFWEVQERLFLVTILLETKKQEEMQSNLIILFFSYAELD